MLKRSGRKSQADLCLSLFHYSSRAPEGPPLIPSGIKWGYELSPGLTAETHGSFIDPSSSLCLSRVKRGDGEGELVVEKKHNRSIREMS